MATRTNKTDQSSAQDAVSRVSATSKAGTDELQQGGSNLSHVRAHNERLVLSVIRADTVSRADIARRTGLSPQTITLIIRALQSDGLIETGVPVKGKVGQPSVPLTLNANGAFFAGLKIGRRSSELILINFTGEEVDRATLLHAYPEPERIVSFVSESLPVLLNQLPAKCRQRLHGIGVALPFELWNWTSELGAPEGAMAPWANFDFREQLSSATDTPVFIENDATAACGAELTFGRGRIVADFAYFFIGYFIGGGIVLNRSVYAGKSGNAGAFGSLPVLDPDVKGRVSQLIDQASIYRLEGMLNGSVESTPLWNDDSEVWHRESLVLTEWMEQVAQALAMAVISVSAVVDVDAIVIDGSFTSQIKESIVSRTGALVTGYNTKGIKAPDIMSGEVGANARALGAARLPMFSRFLMDQSVLTKALG